MERPSPFAGLRRLIDTLVQGYAVLNRRLWVLAVPIGLDLFLWLGPRITPQMLADALATLWRNALLQAPEAMQVDPELVTEATAMLQTWGSETNLAQLLSGYVIPLLVPRLPKLAIPGYTPASWSPDWIWVLLPIPLAAIIMGLLLWSLYLVPIADLVRESGESGPTMLRRVGSTWWHMVGLLALLLLAGAVLLLVFGLLVMLVILISQTLAALLIYLGMGLVIGAILYLYFTPNAVILSGVRPLRAIRYSIQVVRSNMWPSLGFILLTTVVRLGTAALWQRLAEYPVGVLGGILVNSYIVSGLAAAGLIFYRDRLRDWLARQKIPKNTR